MAETASAAADLRAPDDLISFLQAIPDGRYRRGVRYPQWFLLLVAALGILSGCRSSRDLEAFAKRRREALNQALGLNFKRWPSDAPTKQGSRFTHRKARVKVEQMTKLDIDAPNIRKVAEGLPAFACKAPGTLFIFGDLK